MKTPELTKTKKAKTERIGEDPYERRPTERMSSKVEMPKKMSNGRELTKMKSQQRSTRTTQNNVGQEGDA